MLRIRFLLIPLAFVALAVSPPVSAQTDSQGSPQQVKVLPVPVDVEPAAGFNRKILPAPESVLAGVPFDINGGNSAPANSIRVLAAAEMSRHDRDLAADAESSIRERAGFENLEFNEGAWTYRQLVCPALPNHLLLRFTRHDGARDMSMFSAAVPRNGEGRVHIIPIVRKGYSLFSPAPVGALTIAAFNRIRREENSQATADWLGTGLCYAALAGANPQTHLQVGASEHGSAEIEEMPEVLPPTLMITANSGAVIRFADVSSWSHPMEWNMIFDRNGKLLKATHSPADAIRYRGQPVRPTMDVNDVAASGKQQ